MLNNSLFWFRKKRRSNINKEGKPCISPYFKRHRMSCVHYTFIIISSTSTFLSYSDMVKLTKAKTFQAYLDSCHRRYSCVHCRAHLANHDDLISKVSRLTLAPSALFSASNLQRNNMPQPAQTLPHFVMVMMTTSHGCAALKGVVHGPN